MAEQMTLFDTNPEYMGFVEKFKPKKTTDDCYTPENIYEVVADWVAKEYKLDKTNFIRPFWPGAEYRAQKYPEDCVVVDNPPFSIMSQIKQFYDSKDIKFFLFAPALTLLSGNNPHCHIAVGTSVVFENGASVAVSFVTNLEDCVLRTAPDLGEALEETNRQNMKKTTKQLPKYEYPDYVITAAKAKWFGKYGVEYRLEKKDAMFIRALDAQRANGKEIFGGGYLLSERAAAERAAAERAAAERAAAERWQLSERERQIVAKLGGGIEQWR